MFPILPCHLNYFLNVGCGYGVCEVCDVRCGCVKWGVVCVGVTL